MVRDPGERVYLRDECPYGRTRHDINVISAPVFDQFQRQIMVASLHIGTALTDTEITERPALVATTDTLTKQLGGAKPDPSRSNSER